MMKFYLLFIIGVYCIGNYYSKEECEAENDYGIEKSFHLCTNQNCTKKVSYLKPGTQYFGCYMNSSKHEFTIYIKSFYESRNDTLNNANCPYFNEKKSCVKKQTYLYSSKFKLQNNQYFLIACHDYGTNYQEFPDITQPQIKFNVPYVKKTVKKTLIVPPLFKLFCYAQCKQSKKNIKTKGIPNDNIFCTENYCVVGFNKESKTKKIKINCILNNFEILKELYVDYDIKVSLYDSRNKKRDSNKFEAGDQVCCKPNKKYNASEYRIPISDNLLLSLKKKNSDETIKQRDVKCHTLRENLTEIYLYTCYYGEKRSSTANYKYYVVNKGELRLLSTSLTYIRRVSKTDKVKTIPTNESLSPVDGIYKLNVGDTIECDKQEYGENVGVLNFDMRQITYPLSNLKTLKKSQVTLRKTIQTNPVNSKRFISCYFNNKFTTPAQLLSKDETILKFYYVSPPWKSVYLYYGSQLACLLLNDLTLRPRMRCHFRCDLRIITFYEDMNYDKNKARFSQIISIKYKEKKAKAVYMKCVAGSLVVYQKFFVTKSLQEVVDPKRSVFMPGDYVFLTIVFLYHETPDYPIYIPIETVISDSRKNRNRTIYEESFSQKGALIKPPKNKETRYYITRKTAYTKRYYPRRNKIQTETNMDTAIELYVARNYYVVFYPNLQNLFENSVLQCYVCANYTFHLESRNCEGKNKKNSKVKLITKKPNGKIVETNFIDKVKMPKVELKPDKKSYYDIADYEIYVKCQTRNRDQKTIKITVKSCLSNPPFVVIQPPNRIIFQIGDSVSCISKSEECTEGISYTIEVKKSEDMYEKQQTPITLSKRYAGHNILVNCYPGKSQEPSETRYIRVEVAPFNVSIKPFKDIAAPGDYYRCVSDGFPKPTYHWEQLLGPSKLRISETFLLVTAYDKKGKYEVKCTARNKLRSASVIFKFRVFNPLIQEVHYSNLFYFLIPTLTILYLGILIFCISLIFQEMVYDTTLFSNGIVFVLL